MRRTLRRELDAGEARLAARMKRTGRLYAFLREVQPDLFDETFQAEIEAAYGVPRGTAPIPPALLAMVKLLQAHDQVSNADAVDNAAWTSVGSLYSDAWEPRKRPSPGAFCPPPASDLSRTTWTRGCSTGR